MFVLFFVSANFFWGCSFVHECDDEVDVELWRKGRKKMKKRKLN